MIPGTQTMFFKSPRQGFEPVRSRGFSLIELMIAITLGLVISGFLINVLVSTNVANREVEKANRQIENGRYAMELMRDELKLAGFYGDFGELVTVQTVMPAVCTADVANLLAGLNLPVQVIKSASASALGACTGSPLVVNGTDVVVVRRADTYAICGADTDPNTPAAPTVGEFYVQSSADGNLEVQVGAGGYTFGRHRANGADTVLCKRVQIAAGAKDPSCPLITITANPPGTGCAGFTAATIRKLHVSVFFVSPCNICSPSDNVPTLKRLKLQGGAFAVEPLVDGIESLKVELGIDDSTESDITSYGSPDRYISDAGTNFTDWANIVAVRVHILSRNLETSPDYVDKKRYTLDPADGLLPAFGDGYKRHVFSSLVRLENLSARREVP